MVKKWQKDHNISRNLVSKIEKRDWGRGERESERERNKSSAQNQPNSNLKITTCQQSLCFHNTYPTKQY